MMSLPSFHKSSSSKAHDRNKRTCCHGPVMMNSPDVEPVGCSLKLENFLRFKPVMDAAFFLSGRVEYRTAI